MDKNSINLWLIASVFLVIVLWWSMQPNLEGFELPGSFDLPGGSLPLGSRIHVRLDSNGNALYESFKPPSAHGEHGCTQVPCPNKFADNMTCWCCCNYH